MREMLMNMLAKQCGLPGIPRTPQEFVNFFMNDPQFSSDRKKAEEMGILKRGDDGSLTIIDQDKMQDAVMFFVKQFFRR